VLSISGWLRRTVAIAGVATVGGGLAYWNFSNRLPPISHRTLRIGWENVPPVQIRTSDGYAGLAVDTIREAAQRAHIKLEWVETGTSSDEAFRKGLVDLWPLMADLPDRRKRVHFTRSWLHSGHTMLIRAGSPLPEKEFAGRIAMFRMPLHERLLREEYPSAQPVPFTELSAVLKAVCSGATAGAFMELRAAMNALRDKPAECAAVDLRAHMLQDQTLQLAIASTFESAGAAELLRSEISGLFRDGTMAVNMSKYSYYGLDDTWATYDLMEAAEHTRWVTLAIGALALALGVLLWRIVSSRQRRRVQAVLRESEERFRVIFQQAAVGVAQVSLSGEALMLNDNYCEFLGYTREELLGTKLVENTHPDDIGAVLANRERLLAGEAASYAIDIRCIRRDGTIAWARLHSSLVRDEANRPKYFIVIGEDFTERKRAEEALRESEARFRNMADTAPVMIWVTDTEKLCTFFNKGWLDFTGRTLEQESGYGWVEGVHPEDRETCAATYSSAFDTRHSFQMEQRLRRADGEYRSLLCTGIPRFTESGTFAGYVGCSLDITDLKRGQEQVLATQKLESLGLMAGGIAHDFNNLLGGIVSTSELVLEEIPAGAPGREGIEGIKVVALRAAGIVRELMAYSGKEDAAFEPVDVSRLVGEMLQFLKVTISKQAILNVDLPEGLPAVWANPAQIRQVVMNLITNASEALGERVGVIAVRAAHVREGRDGAGQILLEVSDTGSGMTPEIQAKIFDPFFTTKFTGRGLGLAAAQGIIRRHGGTIRVTSQPGRGSRFEILLPCTDEPAGRGAVAAASAAPIAGTCLVVEDEDALRDAVSRMLRKRGLTVIEAVDGRVAVELFRDRASEIDVVLLDMTLPGMSGREVFDAMQEIRPGVKVVITTAYSQETALTSLGGQRALAYIQKPYQFGDLFALLRETLRETCRPN
jgi:two-component system, cell cycle sensor histidine kinase and response regulator CckA